MLLSHRNKHKIFLLSNIITIITIFTRIVWSLFSLKTIFFRYINRSKIPLFSIQNFVLLFTVSKKIMNYFSKKNFLFFCYASSGNISRTILYTFSIKICTRYFTVNLQLIKNIFQTTFYLFILLQVIFCFD